MFVIVFEGKQMLPPQIGLFDILFYIGYFEKQTQVKLWKREVTHPFVRDIYTYKGNPRF